jgi:uncharacterized membrane protein YgaE (UPF0421/DUF939 family)
MTARTSAAAVAATLREAVAPARLLFAAKTALAVGIAWAVAPLMPGVTDEFPYYAPLGALISMYPTLMSSAKSSLQTLLGLAAGIGLAILIVLTVGPSLWSVVVAVGIGTLVSGTGWFGVGREYIPMAALFVLIIGGQNADAYSLGYIAQMAVGVTIGLAVNLLVPPAPLGAEAAARIDAFQHRLSAHLRGIADAVQEAWPPEHSEWAQDVGALAETTRTLRSALAEADESRLGNPRAWRQHADTQDQHRRLEVLEEIAHQIRDISGCLTDTIWERPGAFPLDAELEAPLAAACRAAADLLDSADPDDRDRADDAVRTLLDAVHIRSIDADTIAGPGVLTAMHLQRIVLLVDPADDSGEARER